VYHLNVSPDSGNATFTYILGPGVFARSALCDRLLELKCPTHFVYGEHDWMDQVIGRQVSKALNNRGVVSTHHVCPDAGHQVRKTFDSHELTQPFIGLAFTNSCSWRIPMVSSKSC
jgi:cardiolipin-specific phospholipase